MKSIKSFVSLMFLRVCVVALFYLFKANKQSGINQDLKKTHDLEPSFQAISFLG